MESTDFEQHWMRKARRLMQALMMSAALNIGLLGTFLYFVFKEKMSLSEVEYEPQKVALSKEQVTLQTVLAGYSTLSFQELLLRLGNKDHVEQGYTKRDLALACLVGFHHFNLERALGGLTVQKRKLYFANSDNQEVIEIASFPGLADYQYQAIVQYAEMEKWPLTPQGIFFEIKSTTEKEPSLMEAFYLTPHFHFIHTLFTKSGLFLKKELLIQLLKEGSWNLVEETAGELRQTGDFSVDQRRALLLRYLEQHSKTAAIILLQTDPEFALKKLDDAQVLQVIDLLTIHTPKVFAKQLLASPRSDAVLKKAALVLYLHAQEAIPEPFDLNMAKHLFLGTALPTQEAAPKAMVKPEAQKAPHKATIVHTIEPGDSLWKLSQKYKVPIETIMRLNKMETEKLRPGKTLLIPRLNQG